MSATDRSRARRARNSASRDLRAWTAETRGARRRKIAASPDAQSSFGEIFKPGEGSGLRSSCRCDIPADRSSPTRSPAACSSRTIASCMSGSSARGELLAARPRRGQRVVMAHAAHAESERVQRLFAALDLPQLLGVTSLWYGMRDDRHADAGSSHAGSPASATARESRLWSARLRRAGCARRTRAPPPAGPVVAAIVGVVAVDHDGEPRSRAIRVSCV